MKLAKQKSDPDDKIKSAGEEQNDSGHLGEDVGPVPVHGPGFFEDAKVVFQGTIGPFGSRATFLDFVVAFRSPRDFIDQAGVLFDRHVGGKTETVYSMRTTGAMDFFLDAFEGRASEAGALFEAGEGQALSFLVETVGPAQQAAGGKRPALLIIAPLQQGLFGQVFIPAVVVNDRDGAPGADVLVVGGDVIFCISDIDPDLAAMVRRDLVIIDDDPAALFGVAGDVGSGHGKFELQMHFHRSSEHQVVPEDFFFAVWILSVPSDPDSGISVFGEFGAADSHGTVMEVYGGNSRAQGVDAQPVFFQFLLDPKQESGIFLFLGELAIGKREPAGKQLNLGFFDLFRETVAGAFGIYPDFGSEVTFGQVVEAIKNAASDFLYHVMNGDFPTLVTEIGLPCEIPEGKQRSCISQGKPLYLAHVG